jgi:hypothetical protein
MKVVIWLAITLGFTVGWLGENYGFGLIVGLVIFGVGSFLITIFRPMYVKRRSKIPGTPEWVHEALKPGAGIERD